MNISKRSRANNIPKSPLQRCVIRLYKPDVNKLVNIIGLGTSVFSTANMAIILSNCNHFGRASWTKTRECHESEHTLLPLRESINFNSWELLIMIWSFMLKWNEFSFSLVKCRYSLSYLPTKCKIYQYIKRCNKSIIILWPLPFLNWWLY